MEATWILVVVRKAMFLVGIPGHLHSSSSAFQLICYIGPRMTVAQHVSMQINSRAKLQSGYGHNGYDGAEFDLRRVQCPFWDMYVSTGSRFN